ncbi:MAG: hypothetical protein MJ176_05580 [Treponema sp.]|nr:hypothetical protein [Treponema sp.]
MKKFNLFLFSLIFATIFVSCTNPLLNPSSGGESKNSYNIRCSIAQEFDDSNKVRTAFPSATGETFSYKVYLNCGSESFSQDVQAYDGTDFSIKVPHKGLWELRVYGAIHGDPVSSTQYILKSEKIYYLNVTDETPSPFQKIIVKPVMTSGVTTGTIDLQAEWDADTGIFEAECICPELSSFTVTNNGTSVSLNADSVPSGSYTVDFDFYKVEGEARILKYNVTEIINVYDGFTTDTWVKHGDDEHLVVSGTPATTTFKVTGDLVKKFLLSSIYVDSNVAADAIQTGSFVAPFKTFDQAWALVGNNFNNENMASCTIYLRGDSTEHKVSAGTSTYNIRASKKLTVKSWDASSPAVLVSEGSDTFFTVLNNGTLVLDNIVVDGNNTVRTNLANGITDSGSVALINTTIRNFNFDDFDHAINVASTGCLSISGKTVIIDNILNSNGNKQNVYIDHQAVLKVEGITSDSRIGISVPSTVEGGTAQNPNSSKHAVFTSGFGPFNSLVKTDEVFISDAGYYPAVDPSTGEAALYASGGRIVKNGYDMIEIKCLKSKIVNPTSANVSGRTVLFNLYNNTTGEDLTSEATWNFTVKYLGADLPETTYWTSRPNSVVFKENLGYDIYSIAATATVDGLSYTTTHDVEVCQINSVASLGETAPTATAASPVTLSVSTQAELKQISDWTRDQKHLENVTIILEKDIECTNYQSIGAVSGEAYSSDDKYFSGIFDGNGHTITIKNFDNTDESSKALFIGNRDNSEVKNLILEGTIKSTKSYTCGFIMAPRGNAKITNCINRMNITSTTYAVAGFVSGGYTNSIVIRNCRNEGNITGSSSVAGFYAAALVAGGTIDKCVNTGNIKGSSTNSSKIGGILDSGSISISNCINKGTISNGSIIGGIAGQSYGQTGYGYIKNCLNTGLVESSKENIGGICGIAGRNMDGWKISKIQNCVNLGPVSCNSPTATSVGNIIGLKYDNNEYTIKNNFYLDQNSYKGIGGTDDDLSSGIETTAFIQTKASCVAYVPNSAYGASSKDVVDMLNIWIKSASGGNDSSFKTYVKWVYKTDSSGKAYPYLTEVE